MSAATLTRPTSHPTRSWLRAAHWQIEGHAWVLGGFLLAALAIAAVVLALVAQRVTPSMSALQIVQQAAPWFPFGSGIYFATTWMGPHVAAGMTRRSFVRASVAAAFVVAAGGAVVIYLLLHAERAVYGLLGWTAGLDEGRVGVEQAGAIGYLWGLMALLAAGALAGLLVGLTFQRFRVKAVCLLPLTLLPLILIALFGLDPARMYSPVAAVADNTFFAAVNSGLTGVVVTVVVLAATGPAIHLLARRTPIRPAQG